MSAPEVEKQRSGIRLIHTVAQSTQNYKKDLVKDLRVFKNGNRGVILTFHSIQSTCDEAKYDRFSVKTMEIIQQQLCNKGSKWYNQTLLTVLMGLLNLNRKISDSGILISWV